MNRALDYRTDFYSLGATFYELFTGVVPLATTDAMELVHCHIAKQPKPPIQINLDLPPVISNIIMKLLEKNAEARYQSAWGLKADLEQCLKQWQTTGQIEHFPLAAFDLSEQFHIPQKLYGRDHEIKTLLAAFERVTIKGNGARMQGKAEMMLVAGYSGIGKSVLVKEIYKSLAEKRGYFITGKFDQLQRNIPYSAIVNAFSELVQQLLTETEAQLAQWKHKLPGLKKVFCFCLNKTVGLSKHKGILIVRILPFYSRYPLSKCRQTLFIMWLVPKKMSFCTMRHKMAVLPVMPTLLNTAPNRCYVRRSSIKDS
jgi:hypothetical protein